MNVLVDAVAARKGGGGLTDVLGLASALPQLRPENDYVFAVQRALERDVREMDPRIRVVVPPPGMQRPPLRLVWEHLVLPRTRGPWRPDVVFSPFNVVPTRWAGRRPRLAVLVANLAPHSPEIREMYRGRARVRLEVLRRLTDRSLLHADRVFLLSREAFTLIREPLLEGKAEVIPLAPPPPVDDPRGPPESVPEPFFVVASDLLRYKGIELVVRAVAELEARERPLVLVCGRSLERSYEASLRRLVEQLGLSDRIRFLGWVEHGRVLRLMRSARGCIVPSRFENMSHVPFEAMSRGAPVIASDLVPFREACGEAALYFSLQDPPQLADHMRALMDDEALRERLSEAGLARVRSMRPSDAAEAILRSFEHLIET